MTSDQQTKRKRKPIGGKNLWIPASLIWTVEALIAADKADKEQRIRSAGGKQGDYERIV